MKKVWLFTIVCVLAVGVSQSNATNMTVYDSQGFENFALGNAAGQTGCYYLNSGATRDGSFQVKTGDTSTATIVDVGGEHNQVLSINNYSGGWSDTWHQIGWEGENSSGWAYGTDNPLYMHITFDFMITSQGAVSGAMTTWRNANQVQQAKVWVQEDTKMECRKDSPSADFWPATDTVPDASAGVWHSFQITTVWNSDSSTSNPIIKAYLDGVPLNAPGEVNTWYAAWGGWNGYLDALSMNYLVNENQALLIDNLVWEYGDEDKVPVPEPVTIALLTVGAVLGGFKRKSA